MGREIAFRLAMILGLATPALAETDNPVVVELYTSQGCSSCPPADEMMHELAAREDVIALALHVDYWDYIGWEDVFADPAYADRQRRYARAAGSASIYTPQMIVNGTDHVIGAKGMELADQIARHSAVDSGVSLEIAREGDALSIAAADTTGAARDLVVQLVRYTPEATVDIRRGENAGRTLSYAQIVNRWQVIGGWDTGEPLEAVVEVTGDDPIVVIVQEPNAGAIVAAARLR